MQTIYNKRKALEIPYVKVGGKLLFSVSELYEWISMGGDRYAAIAVMQKAGRLTNGLEYSRQHRKSPDNAEFSTKKGASMII